jgi:hypothetical protein
VTPVSFRPRYGRRHLTAFTVCLLLSFVGLRSAKADDGQLPIRSARLFWDDAKHVKLSLTVGFRDVLDKEIQSKLSRGLPTTILFTAGLFAPNNEAPVGTTVQTCRVTWHVWEEAYRVEMTRGNTPAATSWTTTIEGVQRRCGEARRLPFALAIFPQDNVPLTLRARVLVNPIGTELMQKIKRWVSRPTSSNTSAPGDALFGTFTGFFMQHVGEAERIVVFGTYPSLPSEAPPAERL